MKKLDVDREIIDKVPNLAPYLAKTYTHDDDKYDTIMSGNSEGLYGAIIPWPTATSFAGMESTHHGYDLRLNDIFVYESKDDAQSKLVHLFAIEEAARVHALKEALQFFSLEGLNPNDTNKFFPNGWVDPNHLLDDARKKGLEVAIRVAKTTTNQTLIAEYVRGNLELAEYYCEVMEATKEAREMGIRNLLHMRKLYADILESSKRRFAN